MEEQPNTTPRNQLFTSFNDSGMEYSFENAQAHTQIFSGNYVSPSSGQPSIDLSKYIQGDKAGLNFFLDPKKTQPNIYIFENIYNKNNIYVSNDSNDNQAKKKAMLMESIKKIQTNSKNLPVGKFKKIAIPIFIKERDERKKSMESNKAISIKSQEKQSTLSKRSVTKVLPAQHVSLKSLERLSSKEGKTPMNGREPRLGLNFLTNKTSSSKTEISKWLTKTICNNEEKKATEMHVNVRTIMNNIRQGPRGLKVASITEKTSRDASLPHANGKTAAAKRKDLSLSSLRDKKYDINDLFAKALKKNNVSDAMIKNKSIISNSQSNFSDLAAKNPKTVNLDLLIKGRTSTNGNISVEKKSSMGLEKLLKSIKNPTKK